MGAGDGGSGGILHAADDLAPRILPAGKWDEQQSENV
jgi:hypothetical protein